MRVANSAFKSHSKALMLSINCRKFGILFKNGVNKLDLGDMKKQKNKYVITRSSELHVEPDSLCTKHRHWYITLHLLIFHCLTHKAYPLRFLARIYIFPLSNECSIFNVKCRCVSYEVRTIQAPKNEKWINNPKAHIYMFTIMHFVSNGSHFAVCKINEY